MRFSLAQLSIIGAARVAGAAYRLLTRQALLSGISANPNDFFSLFLLIISTTAWIDFIGSLPIIGLALISAASRSFGAVVGVVVLDHKTLPLISLSITASLEITSLVVVGIAGFRLLDFIGYKGSERKKGDLYAYLKLLGLALSISFLSALFESASILGMLPFGL